MWLRRMGVPPLWPSRMKILMMGFLSSIFTLTVFQYLNGANAQYLNLATPESPRIACLYPSRECANETDPLTCMLDTEHHIMPRERASSACPMPASLVGDTCHNASLPLWAFIGESSRLHTAVGGFNPLRLWSWLFLVLMVLTSVLTVMHDLALLEDSKRPQILTLLEMAHFTPHLWNCLMKLQCRRRSGSSWDLTPSIRLTLWPLWSLVAGIAFMCLVYPFAISVFLFYPIRMSRIMVFLSGILCGLWSIVFMLMTLTHFAGEFYSLWWNAENCICVCKFPLTAWVSMRLLAFGIAVLAHAVSLVLRTLKGLRRSEWANMLTVLYSVPVDAFPVRWERPLECGESGIMWRGENEPVQGEPAFDPFCLMDEQPESSWTRVMVQPVPRLDVLDAMEEDPPLSEIGCCGFPLLRRPRTISSTRRMDSFPPDLGHKARLLHC